MTALTLPAIHTAYASGEITPEDLIDQLLIKIEAADPAIWISRCDRTQLQGYLDGLRGHSPETKPLYGIPFAIKDNIDLVGLPTTAACPAFAYVPEQSAKVVQLLIEAGAIPMGKTNLDQFATGLVGTRSPFGIPANAITPGVISGGSSSGSAVAVALGLVCFALGTDTAGSGRVPASFNNLIGFKPSRGVMSTHGVVPACRSLDCVSIFAFTAEDAATVFALTRQFDREEPLSRPYHPAAPGWTPGTPFRFGVLPSQQREYFGESAADELYEESVARLIRLGGTAVNVDFEPFLEAARLLYGGPWVAERYVATAQLLDTRPETFLEVTRTIIEGGRKPTAADGFRATYRLAELKRASEAVWEQVDVMLTPTAPRSYTVEEVAAEPLLLNTRLGTYTNFMNLLDLCGCAVPAGFLPNQRAWGVTLMAPAFHDERILHLASALHELAAVPLGATGVSYSPPTRSAHSTLGWMSIVVCGAHMEGLPLNPDLLKLGARLNRRATTAPIYRLFHLPGAEGRPDRPGLVRTAEDGSAIDVEVWDMPTSALGTFFMTIKPPLSLGLVTLQPGETVCGFLCEAVATAPDRDITSYGGWRQWLARKV